MSVVHNAVISSLVVHFNTRICDMNSYLSWLVSWLVGWLVGCLGWVGLGLVWFVSSFVCFFVCSFVCLAFSFFSFLLFVCLFVVVVVVLLFLLFERNQNYHFQNYLTWAREPIKRMH